MKTLSKRTRRNRIAIRIKQSRKTGFKEQLIVRFLVFLNMVKLYHWKTYNYASHKASDELYKSFNDNMDRFVEVLLGKLNGERIDLTCVNRIPLIDFPIGGYFDERMKREIESFKEYLVNLEREPFMKTMSNADLWTIRDEILASLNQFLYLLTFR
jgi:hypothetical protein